MLNPSLDLDRLAAEFAVHRRIRIHDVLSPELAGPLAADLAGLAYRIFAANGKGVAVLDPAEVQRWEPARRAELQRELMSAATRSEGFLYNGFRMTEAWAGRSPDTPLGRFYDALRSPATLAAMRHITGADTFDNAFAQATQYLPGHYLTRHLDQLTGETRKFAFVWGYTRPWDPDWGGMLQFFSDDHQPRDALSPGFNTLDLFDVIHEHSVTYVTPFAAGQRLAVSGWFVKGDPLKPR